MRSATAASLVLALGVGAVNGQAQPWGQCGGNGWMGATTCVSGWTCVVNNPWYSQCLQGTGPTTTKTINLTGSDALTTSSRTTPRSSTTPVITVTTPVSRTTSTSRGRTTIYTTTSTKGPVPTGSYPGPTLLSGYYWIRAVAAPHFHEYLQSPAKTAVIASHTTAGQFQIVAGQLVQNTAAGPLYANVEQRSDSTDLLLGVTFSATKNAFGSFSWSGDALQWTVPSINRPNASAWYVCGANNQLFINLGQYLYGTPAGCADQTIHFYNGATADA